MRVLGHPLTPPPVARTSQRAALATLSLYEGARPAPAQGLGFLDSIIGGLFGMSAMKSQAKAAEKSAQLQSDALRWSATEQTNQARIMAEAYSKASVNTMRAAERAAEMELRAATQRSDKELAAVREQYRSALSALELQRLAAVDQQVANIVNNTAAATFALAGQNVSLAAGQMRSAARTGVWGVVALGVLTMGMVAYSQRKDRKKGKGGKAPLSLGEAA